jgi:hypothetical protein
LVVAIGVDFRLADEFTVVGREGDDVIEDVETDRLTAVGPADVEMSKLSEIAQRDVTSHVDRVGADVPVRLVDECVGFRFGTRVIGDARRSPIDSAVWAHVVVVANDLVDDHLELAKVVRGTLREELFQGAVPAVHLRAGLWERLQGVNSEIDAVSSAGAQRITAI